MIVEVRDLVKRYGEKLAVDNMNFSVRRGEIVGLLGPNGAGKTTLINSIIGITETQSGDIFIFGEDMTTRSMQIKRRIGVVPQNIALINEFTAVENITYFARLYELKGTQLKEAVKEAIEFTNLWDRRNDYPKKFSGGMLRRLNIAFSIVHKPELIIMDEPTVGVDPQSRKHILESIKRLNELGSTIIYTSHYMEEVEALCTRVVIMDNGRLIAEGTKEKLAEYVQVEQAAQISVNNPGFSITEAVKKVLGVKECSVITNIRLLAKGTGLDSTKFSKALQEFDSSKLVVKNESADSKQIPQSRLAMGFLVQFMLYMSVVTAGLILEDKNSGVFFRVFYAPVSLKRYLIENMAAFLIIGFLQVTLILSILKYLFGMDLGNHPSAMYALFLMFSLVCISLGMYLVSLFKKPIQAYAAIFLATSPLVMLGSCYWPPDLMPSMMNKIAQFIPTSWVMDGVDKILFAGKNLAGISMDILMLVIFAGIFLAAGLLKQVDISK